MKPELPNSPEGRLIDELLHQQAEGQDPAFLQQIEKSIDAKPIILRKLPVRRNYTRIAIAACFGLAAGGLFFHHLQSRNNQAEIVAYQATEKKLSPSLQIKALEQSIQEQEAIVDTRKKKLTTISRTKDITYKSRALPAATAPSESARFSLQAEPHGGAATLRAPIVDIQSGDRYGKFIDQPWKSPESEPLSTFSIDVDTASYTNVRRMIREERAIPKDAVRIEEFINAFDYDYTAPKGDGPFAVGADLAVCPWATGHQLVRVFIKGRDIETKTRPASNLVFLLDVSGSMQSPDKLPLLKQSLETLVSQLDERDSVAIVVYAGSEGVVLPSTRLDDEGQAKVAQALSNLRAGGSTNGGAGIKRAYQLAMDQKIDGGVNRVILATDGDFNVGVTGQDALVELVKTRAKNNVYLTVVGFGSGNLNDSMMDAITRDGNGNYFYIDSARESEKVFLKNLTGTLVTIAKDVKIQVEFNPAKVGSYRLIGYSNRVLKNEDFSNDAVDAGDIGAGHTVTAFYEIAPPAAPATDSKLKYQTATEPTASEDWLNVKLRYKHPEGDQSSLVEFPLTGIPTPLSQTNRDFQFAAAAAVTGMKLRGMEEVSDFGWDRVIDLAKPGLAVDVTEERAEFVGLLETLNRSGTPDANLRPVGPSPKKAEVVSPAHR